ncbi:hypothetical protein [Bryobacter aggregatus]|uniref:hypothetical protein n=1 Tax=Bryobacter aggregatus TaxID=360054 RepID=UPI0012BABA68|nr:hypothetical protein [Bryobacter aggregatus]
MKSTLFQPLEKVLADRYAETKGAREKAAAALQTAELKVAEYDAKLRAARAEIYQEQEVWRKGLLDEQTLALTQAREGNRVLINEAKRKLTVELDSARATLSQEAESLGNQIVAGIMRGSHN